MHQYLLINLKNLERNIKFIQNLIPKSKICPVLKSDAYGMGLESIALFLFWKCNIFHFALGTVEEAIRLRNIGIRSSEILILKSILKSEYKYIIQYNLLSTISSFEEFINLSYFLKNLNTNISLNYHLKVNTGLNRFGILVEDLNFYLERTMAYQNLKITGIYSHLAVPWKNDQIAKDYGDKQIYFYKQSLQILKSYQKKPCKEHLLGSGGILFYPNFGFDWVRPGILIYGGWLSIPQQWEKNIYNVVEWKVKILSLIKVKAKSFVGYDFAFYAKKDMQLAILGSGYAYGYPKCFQNNKTFAYSNDKKEEKLPVVWVGMDTMIIDISKSSLNFKPNDEIVLMGEQFTLNQLAHTSNRVPHEILTNLNKNIQRLYIYE